MTMPSHLLCASPWAMLPEASQQLMHVCASDLGEPLKQGYVTSPVRPQPVKNSSTRQGRVAILPIRGVILPYTSLLATLFGATCLDQLTQDFCAARDNPDIETIVFDIDSPGGLVTGVHAFSQHVFAARTIKPILAMVSGMAASAAYWIAASAGSIFVDPTACVGSIGVVMTYTDNAEQQKKAGVQSIDIISSQSPYKRLSAATEVGHRALQAQVDQLADVFVTAVAVYRAVPVATVLSDFGQGGLVVGAAAVTQGLADGCQSLTGLLEQPFHTTTGEMMMSIEKSPPPALTAHPEEIKAIVAPETTCIDAVYENGFAAGLEAGKTQERARIASIEAHSVPGHEALIARLKFDGVSTEKEVALQILVAEKVQREQRAQERSVESPDPLPPLDTLVATSSPLSLEEQCKAEWASSSPLREEFYSVEGYIAYRKAEARGVIKRCLK